MATSVKIKKNKKESPNEQIEVDDIGKFEYGQYCWATRDYYLDLGIQQDQLDSALNRSSVELATPNSNGQRTLIYRGDSVKENLVKLGYAEAAEKIRSRAELEQELEQYVQESEEFHTLIELLGASNAVDILFVHRKDFRGVAIDKIESIIGKHLGDMMMNTRKSFNPREVKKVLPYLHIQKFANAFYEVLKDACLAEFVEIRKCTAALSDREILQSCAAKYEDEFFKRNFMRNEHLVLVTDRVKNYFESLFLRFVKPAGMVDRISADREFPDINQLINIREISEKKRFLIADEMGGGKTASAIFAKEVLGVRQAVIVAPSNVISTWVARLSSEVHINGNGSAEQVGYFKDGMAPSVVVVDNPKRLKQADVQDADYILISHECLRERSSYIDKHGRHRERPSCIEDLLALDYSMLIVDEAHKFKNLTQGKRSDQLERLASKIKGENAYLTLLTGTPIPNKIGDLALPFKLLVPEAYKDMSDVDIIQQVVHSSVEKLRSILLPHMQMRRLAELVAMPEKHERIIPVDLSPQEEEMYVTLLEEDEFEDILSKIGMLRKFLMNPAMLDVAPYFPHAELFEKLPEFEGAKVKALREYLHEAFKSKNKIVVFVNEYIADIIRDTDEHDQKSLLWKLGLPGDIAIRTIHGKDEDRDNVVKEFQQSNGKMLLLVSGDTADVGVDFSAADSVVYYSEPWTWYARLQQLGRAYRPGRTGDLEVVTLIVRGTIEADIHAHILMKYHAIEKVLKGIPRTEQEQKCLERNGHEMEIALAVDPELADSYISQYDYLMRLFSRIVGIGESKLEQFLNEYGDKYARCYKEAIGAQSYAANANRVAGTIIHQVASEKGWQPSEMAILDAASGPCMLARHISQPYAGNICSIDKNPKHFSELDYFRSVPASFLHMPLNDGQFHAAALTLALHYTLFRPKEENTKNLKKIFDHFEKGKEGDIPLQYKKYKNTLQGIDRLLARLGEQRSSVDGSEIAQTFIDMADKITKKLHQEHDIAELAQAIEAIEEQYETMQTFRELNRVLKVGGIAVITVPYSKEFEDEGKFRMLVDLLGFRCVDAYTGLAEDVDRRFSARIYTLEKIKHLDNAPLSTFILAFARDQKGRTRLERDNLAGLKLKPTDVKKLKDSRRMVDRVAIGSTEIELEVNERDALVFKEEKQAYADAQALIDQFGSIAAIPKYHVTKNDFGRLTRKKPTLYRPIKNDVGFILID